MAEQSSAISPEMRGQMESALRAAPLSDDVRAKAWDAFVLSNQPEQFKASFDRIEGLPNPIKKQLGMLRFGLGPQEPPSTPAGSNVGAKPKPDLGPPPGPPKPPSPPLPWEMEAQKPSPDLYAPGMITGKKQLNIPQWLTDQTSAGIGQMARGAERFAGETGHGVKPQLDAAHQMFTGAMQAATIPMAAVGLAAPLKTAYVLGAAGVSQQAVEQGLQRLGLPKEYAEVAGDLAAVIAGALAGGAHKEIDARLKAKLEPELQKRMKAAGKTVPPAAPQAKPSEAKPAPKPATPKATEPVIVDRSKEKAPPFGDSSEPDYSDPSEPLGPPRTAPPSVAPEPPPPVAQEPPSPPEPPQSAPPPPEQVAPPPTPPAPETSPVAPQAQPEPPAPQATAPAPPPEPTPAPTAPQSSPPPAPPPEPATPPAAAPAAPPDPTAAKPESWWHDPKYGFTPMQIQAADAAGGLSPHPPDQIAPPAPKPKKSALPTQKKDFDIANAKRPAKPLTPPVKVTMKPGVEKPALPPSPPAHTIDTAVGWASKLIGADGIQVKIPGEDVDYVWSTKSDGKDLPGKLKVLLDGVQKRGVKSIEISGYNADADKVIASPITIEFGEAPAPPPKQ